MNHRTPKYSRRRHVVNGTGMHNALKFYCTLVYTYPMKQWNHAPVHLFSELGTYMVTGATFQKQLLFNTENKLQLLHDTLHDTAGKLGWQLHAWAVFPNHYHFLAHSPDNPETLSVLIRRIHGASAKNLNAQDGVSGRKVWFQYWDKWITHQTSYYARLQYVHNNPVHHGLVDNAVTYPWCSASWFEKTATKSFYKTISEFKTDRLNIPDVY